MKGVYMNILTMFSHTGHHHEDGAAESASTLIVLGVIIGGAVFLAALLVVINFLRSPTRQFSVVNEDEDQQEQFEVEE